MKQKIYYLIALCLAVSTVTYAQNDEPADEPEAVTTIAQVLKEAEGFTVFARLVEACGLQEELSKVLDETYEQAYQQGLLQDLPRHPSMGQAGTIPQHRRYGYTLFAERDAMWENVLNKKAADITVADVRDYLVRKGHAQQGTADDNYTDANNIINLFTTYHILPERLTPDKLVIHYNEKGYNYRSSSKPTIPVEEFYVPLGQPRLLKVYESAESDGIYLNRFPVLRNGRGDFSAASAPDDAQRNDYHEAGTMEEGIPVIYQEGENDLYKYAVNGILYPIDNVLTYTERTRELLGNQRMRFDVASLLPEMMNNDLRRPMGDYPYGSTGVRAFPCSDVYSYFDNLSIAPGTSFYYLSGYSRTWSNYQGDEFNVVGQYDFTLKLPPVPADGEYELRFGVSSGSNNRSVAQFYFGEDKDNLQTTGLPIDMRIGGQVTRYFGGTSRVSTIGWEEDTGDEAYNRLVDLRLYEQGFMKGPNYFTYDYSPVRTQQFNLRRIIWRGKLEAGKTYYLRIQNCMENTVLEFYMDYIEWCPKSVYANPDAPEDIW